MLDISKQKEIINLKETPKIKSKQKIKGTE